MHGKRSCASASLSPIPLPVIRLFTAVLQRSADWRKREYHSKYIIRMLAYERSSEEPLKIEGGIGFIANRPVINTVTSFPISTWKSHAMGS